MWQKDTHYVPEAVREAIRAKLSTDADRVFKKGLTGNPYSETHGWDKPHVEYNKRVLNLANSYIGSLAEQGKLENGKLSGNQAEYFIQRIKKDGFGDQQVYLFNQKVLTALRVITLGGIAAGGMRQFEKLRKFAQSQKLKNYYMIAKNALEKGDWKTANQAIRGGGAIGSDGENLINELIKLGYYREAIIFEGEWKGRLLELRTVEAGQSVPRVPNNFEAFERE